MTQQPLQEPALVPSVTEDDDDQHERLVQDVRASKGSNRDALAFLLRYETMVRQQEAEDMATLAHIRPCVERLEALAGIPATTKKSISDSALLTREISFASLKRALQALEANEYKSSSNNNNSNKHASEFMTTDRQLMMVLRLLTQKLDETGDGDSGENVYLAWAEFFQAYKVCIVGMLTLQHLPASSAIRTRTRDRTLAMLSLFEAPSTELFRANHDNGAVEPVVDWSTSAALTEETKRVGAAARDNNSLAKVLSPRSSRKKQRRRRLAALALLLGTLAALVYVMIVPSSASSSQAPAASSLPQVEATLTTPSSPANKRSNNKASLKPAQQERSDRRASNSKSEPSKKDRPPIDTTSSSPERTTTTKPKVLATATTGGGVKPSSPSVATTTTTATTAKMKTKKTPPVSTPVRMVPTAELQIPPQQQHEQQQVVPRAGTRVVRYEMTARDTLAGGVVGLLAAPLALPAVQGVLVVSSTTAVARVAAGFVFGAGLVSVAAMAFTGLLGLLRRFSAGGQQHQRRRRHRHYEP